MKTRGPADTQPVAPAAILDFLRHSADRGSWTVADVARMLGVDRKEADQAIATLAAAGYIEPVPKKRGAWRNTAGGNEVAGVPKTRPVARKTAEQNLKAFLDRVRQVNADPRFLYRVEQSVVFGPFVASNEPVRAVDIGIRLAPKEADGARHEKLVLEHAAAAERAGKHFTSYAAKLRYGEDEVRAFLKARVRSIALHNLEEWMMREPHRVYEGASHPS